MANRYNALRIVSCRRERNTVGQLWHSQWFAFKRRTGETYENAINRALKPVRLKVEGRPARPLTMLGPGLPTARIAQSSLPYPGGGTAWLEVTLAQFPQRLCHHGRLTPAVLFREHESQTANAA